MGLPLDGIRVIDLGQIFAAPYCTLQLAQMGAEIIKIEPPGVGESLRRAESSPGGVVYSFLMLNANNRSVTLMRPSGRGRPTICRSLWMDRMAPIVSPDRLITISCGWWLHRG